MPFWTEIRPPADAEQNDADLKSRLRKFWRASAAWLPATIALALVFSALGMLAVQQSSSPIEPAMRQASPPTASRTVLIDLNSATAAELSTLPRIGDTRANAIILSRNRQPFDSLADLVDRGILRASELPAIAELAAAYVDWE